MGAFLKECFKDIEPQLSGSEKISIQAKLLQSVDLGWLHVADRLAEEYLKARRYEEAERLEKSVAVI